MGRWLSNSWIDTSLITEFAKKADNAAVPTHIWDIIVCDPFGLDHQDPPVQRSLTVLRRFLLHRLHFNVISSFIEYMQQHPAWLEWLTEPTHRFHYPWLFITSLHELRALRHSGGGVFSDFGHSNMCLSSGLVEANPSFFC